MAGDHEVNQDTSGEPAPALNRRGLLRGGAIIAGAAVGGVAATALTAPAAEAADGDAVLAGRSTGAESSTGIEIGDGTGSADPTLKLSNANGPSLYLEPLAADYAGQLELGQIANTVLGPVIGVDSLLGETTTFLATGIDLADLPTPYALPKPIRVLDTSSAAGRQRIIRMSSGALDSAGRMTPKSWLDLEVAVEDADFIVPSAYLNVSAVSPVTNGYLSAYPPGDFPGTSTLNFQAKVTIANLAFVSTAIVQGRYAVRIYSSALTRVVADLTGVTIKGSDPSAGLAAQRTTRTAKAARRLRSTLTDRVRRSLSR